MTAAFNIALPGSIPRLAQTWTCDAQGNWRQETRALSKDANGWHDRPINERTEADNGNRPR
jgi:hypothetical protein